MSDSNIIIVGFSRPKAKFQFFAEAIMAVDGKNFSHVYIRFWSETYQRDLVYQASGLRVNFMGWKMFEDAEVIVKEFAIPVSAETKQSIVQFAIDNVGMPYSLSTALGIVPVKVMKLFGVTIKNPVSQVGFFCSKIADTILKKYLMAEFTQDDIDRMTPGDTFAYLSQRFGTKE